MTDRPDTLGALRASGWRPRSVKQEMRDNLVAKLRAGETLFPGLVGYDETVVPRVVNAVLAGHDMILLGLRGQAKTRILRSLPSLLDEALPFLAGSEVNDDPFAPISAHGKRLVAEHGDDAPVAWIGREQRYHEKLATPDVTIADLIGDIDPIKAASRRLAFDDEGVIHFGLVPRTHRGILAINELPDLQARIQVGLLNILEEGDVQIRGFPVRFPLDVALVFSANPEDYTNRGNIITPLRDRIASQVLTHYPRTLEEGMAITAQEAWTEREGAVEVSVPELVRRTVEHVAFAARASEFVDQDSGVSARMTIALMETVVSNAERRALVTGAERAIARLADLFAATAAIAGKIELVYEGEREGVQAVSLHLLGKAVKASFDELFPPATPGGEGEPLYEPILEHFRGGATVELSDELSDEELEARLAAVAGLAELVDRHLQAGESARRAGEEGRRRPGAPDRGAAPDEGTRLAAMELVLEGLHQSALLSKDELVAGRVYTDPFDEMARSLDS